MTFLTLASHFAFLQHTCVMDVQNVTDVHRVNFHFFPKSIDLTGLVNIINVGAPQPTFALAMSYLGY